MTIDNALIKIPFIKWLCNTMPPKLKNINNIKIFKFKLKQYLKQTVIQFKWILYVTYPITLNTWSLDKLIIIIKLEYFYKYSFIVSV